MHSHKQQAFKYITQAPPKHPSLRVIQSVSKIVCLCVSVPGRGPGHIAVVLLLEPDVLNSTSRRFSIEVDDPGLFSMVTSATKQVIKRN